MSDNSKTNRPVLPVSLPTPSNQTKEAEQNAIVRAFKRLKRSNSTPSEQFQNFLDLVNKTDEEREKFMQAELTKNYAYWAKHFEVLKQEFNAVWDFFEGIEADGRNWFCVSPTLSRWKGVSHTKRGGYRFSACIMKNVDRNAPLSEKSVTVSYGLDQWGGGIGDELGLGRESDVDDTLVGLEACQGKVLQEQFEASKDLVQSVNRYKLSFRLNHQRLGQESTSLALDILEKHSLVELCEKLFFAVNNDIVKSLNSELSQIEGVKLISNT